MGNQQVTDCVFQGSDQLVARLDRAVADKPARDAAQDVKAALSELIGDRVVELPEALCRPQADCYARRLLYRSPAHGYEVIAMIWGPGQGTPLHDHAGIWCVDGVLHGQVSVTQYDLLEKEGGRFRFAAQRTVQAQVGEAGSLIPPFEYHTIENPSNVTSVTIHVYGGAMDCCTIFEPSGADGWYVRRRKQLSYSEREGVS